MSFEPTTSVICDVQRSTDLAGGDLSNGSLTFPEHIRGERYGSVECGSESSPGLRALHPPAQLTPNILRNILRFFLLERLAPGLYRRLSEQIDERWSRVFLRYQEVSDEGRIVLANSDPTRTAAGKRLTTDINRIWESDAPTKGIYFVSNEKAQTRMPKIEDMTAPCCWNESTDQVLIKEQALEKPGLPLRSRRLGRWLGEERGERNFRLAIFLTHECNERYIAKHPHAVATKAALFVARYLCGQRRESLDAQRETAANLLTFLSPVWSKHSVFRLFRSIRNLEIIPPIPLDTILEAASEGERVLPSEHRRLIQSAYEWCERRDSYHRSNSMLNGDIIFNSHAAYQAARQGLPARVVSAALLMGISEVEKRLFGREPLNGRPMVSDDVLRLVAAIEDLFAAPLNVPIEQRRDRTYRTVENLMRHEIHRIMESAEVHRTKSSHWTAGHLFSLYGITWTQAISAMEGHPSVPSAFLPRLRNYVNLCLSPLLGVLSLRSLKGDLMHETFRATDKEGYIDIHTRKRTRLGMSIEETDHFVLGFMEEIPKLLQQEVTLRAISLNVTKAPQIALTVAEHLTPQEFINAYSRIAGSLPAEQKEELNQALLNSIPAGSVPSTIELLVHRGTLGTSRVAIRQLLEAAPIEDAVSILSATLESFNDQPGFTPAVAFVQAASLPSLQRAVQALIDQNLVIPGTLLDFGVGPAYGGEKRYFSTKKKEDREKNERGKHARRLEDFFDLVRSEQPLPVSSLRSVEDALRASIASSTLSTPPIFGGYALVNQAEVGSAKLEYVKEIRLEEEPGNITPGLIKIVFSLPSPNQQGVSIYHELQLVSPAFSKLRNYRFGRGFFPHDYYKAMEEANPVKFSKDGTPIPLPANAGQRISHIPPRPIGDITPDFVALYNSHSDWISPGLVDAKVVFGAHSGGIIDSPNVTLPCLPRGSKVLSLACLPCNHHLSEERRDPTRFEALPVSFSTQPCPGVDLYNGKIRVITGRPLRFDEEVNPSGIYALRVASSSRDKSAQELEEIIPSECYSRAKLMLRYRALELEAPHSILGKSHFRDSRNAYAIAGQSLLKEMYGLPRELPIRKQLIEDVFRPIAHDLELHDERELFEVLGATDQRGVAFLSPDQVEAWVRLRYIGVDVSTNGGDTIRIDFAADRLGFANEALKIISAFNVNIAEAKVLTENGTRSLVFTLYDGEPRVTAEICRDLRQLKLLGLLGEKPPLANGIRTKLEAFILDEPGTLAEIMRIVSERNFSLIGMQMDSKPMSNEIHSGFHIERPIKVLELELSGPANYEALGEVSPAALSDIKQLYRQLHEAKIRIDISADAGESPPLLDVHVFPHEKRRDGDVDQGLFHVFIADTDGTWFDLKVAQTAADCLNVTRNRSGKAK